MIDNSLLALSPLDGRYVEKTEELRQYFSESALFKYRLKIEIKYLIFLAKIRICRHFSNKEIKILENIYQDFSLTEAERIKKLESETKHDVKALEYFLKERLKKTSLTDTLHFIHFGLTSNDINDNSYRLMIKDSLKKIIVSEIENLVTLLESISKKYLKLPMLARTHGQAAVPTTLGKEILVFASRLKKETVILKKTQLSGKFGGAVGNWNSLNFVFPKRNWLMLSTTFLKSLGLSHSKVTTQIAPAEDLLTLFQNLFRINSILLDLNQDFWRYISDDWLKQKGKEKQVGSSTMPQKINPIEFENSEGNLIIANGLLESLCRKLPISRLQRDLSDSTVLRNIGVAFGHCLLAYKSCLNGLTTIEANKEKILKDLNENWSILTEALQTILRKEGKTDAYETVANKIRGKKLNKNDWLRQIDSLKISKQSKNKLKNLTPENYIGITLNKW